MQSKFARRGSILALAAVAVMAAVGIGYAAIPGPDGKIKGCYATTNGLLLGVPHSKGDTRIVDSGEACRSYEKTIAWNQQGPPGEPGEPGASAAALWAVMNGDGTIARSSHVVAGGGTQRVGTGNYMIEFDRVISGCAFVATAQGQFGNETATIAAQPSGFQVQVFTSNASGASVDSKVHLAVLC